MTLARCVKALRKRALVECGVRQKSYAGRCSPDLEGSSSRERNLLIYLWTIFRTEKRVFLLRINTIPISSSRFSTMFLEDSLNFPTKKRMYFFTEKNNKAAYVMCTLQWIIRAHLAHKRSYYWTYRNTSKHIVDVHYMRHCLSAKSPLHVHA